MSRERAILVIAHRGASGECPENTLPAFERAIALGSDMIELDAQLTKDGEIVVIHDDTVDRTTDGSGRVSDFTLRDIRRLDAGAWFDRRFAGQHVPTLEEVLALLRPPLLLNLELKGPDGDGRLQKSCLDLVGAAGLLGRTIFSSFSGSTMKRLRIMSPRARMGVLVPEGGDPARAFSFARRFGAEAIHPDRTLVTRELVDAAHGEGLAVYVWPVNEPGEIEALLKLGVDGIFTDYPDRVAAHRGA